MKKNLVIAAALMVTLVSCRPKIVYVDRPVSNPASAQTPAPAQDNRPYQSQAGDYSSAPAQQTNSQQYNGNQQQSSDQYYSQESDQDYYYHQQHVNYGSSSYQTFYDELAPYGSWVDYPGYGYAWVPAQGAGFRPYVTNGYWAYSEYGWTWVSNYNWGWAPFHYGNWMMDPAYGWVWVPGHTWAPAWVSWGQCNGYYGWAPIAPGVNMYDGYRAPAHYWNFVPQGQFGQSNVSSYVVNHNTNTTIINNNTTNITVINNNTTYNNVKYNAGPQVSMVEHSVGHKITPITLSTSAKPIAAGEAVKAGRVSIYKPEIAPPTAVKAAPTSIVPIQNVKTVNSAAVKGVLPRTNPSSGHPGSDIHRSEPVERNPVQQQPKSGQPTRDMPANQSHPVGQPERSPVQQHNPNEGRPVGVPEHEPVIDNSEHSRPTGQPERSPVQGRPIERQPQQQPPVERQPESRPIERQPQQQPPIERQPQQQPQQQPRTIEHRSEPVQRNPNPQPQQQPRQAPRPQPQPKPIQRSAPPREEGHH